MFFFGCSEVNSTWLITSELANQRARKALFACVVYTKMRYDHGLFYNSRAYTSIISLTVFLVLISPSSGGLNHVELGQDISNFMSPTRIAAPW